MPDQISDLLLSLGIHSTHKGYRFLHYGLSLCLSNEDYLLAVYKHLYVDIARKFGTSQSNVERCIRTAVFNCYHQGGREFLCRIAQYPLQGKPTNSEFLDILYHYLKSQEEKKQEEKPT